MKTVTSIFFCLLAMSALAQNTFPSSGNVGIGTNSPIGPLHIKTSSVFFNPGSLILENSGGTSVYGLINSSDNLFLGYNSNAAQSFPQTNFTGRFYISSGGNIGIGTSSPYNKLHVDGNMAVTADTSTPYYYEFKRTSDGWLAARMGQVFAASWGSHLVFETNAGATSTNVVERMRVTSGGNVLIGKTTQANTAYKLDVNGSARLNEVVVNGTGADFVFENTYNLPSLAEVERFIKDFKHLPEIQTAADMEANGVAVGDISMKLLQKVEELTLYVIDLNKKTDALAAENEKLRAQLKSVYTK